eukprot:1156863-Pelagomonas_calceolata.AAC.7
MRADGHCGNKSGMPLCPIVRDGRCAGVRDRATLYQAQLSGKAGGTQAIVGKPDVSLEVLEKNLQGYLESEHTEQPFDMVGVEDVHLAVDACVLSQ